MENTPNGAPISLGDGPNATAVTFHGVDGSATVWVDPIGHVKLSPELVRALAEGVVSRNTAEANERAETVIARKRAAYGQPSLANVASLRSAR